MERISLRKDQEGWAQCIRALDLVCETESAWPFLRPDGMQAGESIISADRVMSGSSANPQLMRRASLTFRNTPAISIREIRNGRNGVAWHSVTIEIHPAFSGQRVADIAGRLVEEAGEMLKLVRAAERRKSSDEAGDMMDLMRKRPASGRAGSAKSSSGGSGRPPARDATPQAEIESVFDISSTPRLTRE